MKKLFVCLCACLLLAACGKEETKPTTDTDNKKETKVCTTEIDGADTEITVDAEDDVITFITMEMKMPDMGMEGVEITDEFTELIKSQMMKELDIEEGKGVDVDIDLKNDTMTIIIKIDMKDGNPIVLNKLGLGALEDHKLSDFLDEAEDEGIVCK